MDLLDIIYGPSQFLTAPDAYRQQTRYDYIPIEPAMSLPQWKILCKNVSKQLMLVRNEEETTAMYWICVVYFAYVFSIILLLGHNSSSRSQFFFSITIFPFGHNSSSRSQIL